ncbi:MAG: hypothetical protein A2293_03695 [Elusimicrobia bacterium RIFOXYB2_FULL_49_7]|nr:MAG: hypothetical protein A2293_03695 [Elusimicrobia bacterium RIFOXYB2_FULL_49_7]
MRLYQHVVASGFVSGVVYGVTRSPTIAAVCFFTGFLVDLDHLLDYWMSYPLRFDLPHFFKTCEEYKLVKVHLWLHSLELLPILALITWFTRSAAIAGFTIGLAQHLLFDYLANRIYPESYFVLYRWGMGFVNEKVFDVPEEFRNGHRS